MENENMIIEEAVVAEGEEIIIEEVPTDAIDVVVEEEGATAEPVEEVEGVIAQDACDCGSEICEDDCECEDESATEMLSRKCREVKEACCGTIDRIIYDLRETNYNPYIKQTRINRIEIYRNCNEEEPIDTFETTDVKSYSAKALAVAGVAAALLVVASNGIVKKFLK